MGSIDKPERCAHDEPHRRAQEKQLRRPVWLILEKLQCASFHSLLVTHHSSLLSMVACQPAIDLSISLLVAVDAKPHLKIHLAQTIGGGHRPMAHGAIDLAPRNVGLMPELDIIRDTEDANPLHRLSGFVVLLLFHQLRVIGDDVLVAKKTLLHDGNTGVFGPVHKGMAETAVDLLDPSVYPMAEVDGLLGTDIFLRIP